MRTVAASTPRPPTERWSPGWACIPPWAIPGFTQDFSQAETFFSALKNKRVSRTTYATKDRKDVIHYIEGF